MGNVGAMFLHRQFVVEFVKLTYNLHPDTKYVDMYDLTTPLIVIRDLEIIKAVTLKHFDMFMDHRRFIMKLTILFSVRILSPLAMKDGGRRDLY